MDSVAQREAQGGGQQGEEDKKEDEDKKEEEQPKEVDVQVMDQPLSGIKAGEERSSDFKERSRS